MRIIIDTNIFIHREENNVLQDELQELLKILNELNYKIILHPLSVKEIEKDKDDARKKINLSKLNTYPKLADPPTPDNDNQFISAYGPIDKLNEHDIIDMHIMYSIYKNAVHFLITEDQGIHTKAKKIDISDRIFDIRTALESFKKIQSKQKICISAPYALKQEFAYNIDLSDTFFDSLKKDYGKDEFNRWWGKISRQGRKPWVYIQNEKIGATILHKEEYDIIESIPPLPKKKRIKICTLKVSTTGHKIGELFIKMSIDLAIQSNIDELYLTHFITENDYLVRLIEEYGFRQIAKLKRNNEPVFVKRLIPEEKINYISQIRELFYPSFYDGEKANKFIIPIKPEYHTRLFTEYNTRQTILPEFMGGFIIEGNTIKKAYLCHANIKNIQKGDLLLFYRSDDLKEITSIGVVDTAFNDLLDPDEIMRHVLKRTVYSRKDIEEMAKKATKVILFKWHFHFPNPINYYDLLKKNIVSGPIQSIQSLSHKDYLEIKRMSGINERFTIPDI